MKRVVILGSTGSIGTQALEVIRQRRDLFCVVGLQARSNYGLLGLQADEFRPPVIAVSDAPRGQFGRFEARGGRVLTGHDGLLEIASIDADITLVAISGTAALEPALCAARASKRIALANKESIVCAGEILKRAIRESGAELIPVDSEHSAIFQCLASGRRQDVKRVILTASGGPFYGWPRSRLARITAEMALQHPKWKMGPKITVDSATLMNKGLEVIEAHHLFCMDYSAIDVVIHPQSIVHSMVEFVDGSVIAQLGTPDMRVPIQYAFSHPERLPGDDAVRYDPVMSGDLSFRRPDLEAFPLLGLAYHVGRKGGVLPCVMSAANEIAVEQFLTGGLRFLEIERVITAVISEAPDVSARDVREILEVDCWARSCAREKAALIRKGVSL